MLRIAVSFIIILFVVVCGSVVSGHFWAGEKEQLPESVTVTINEGMTVAEFGKQHNLGRKVLKKVFGLGSPNDLKRQVADFGMSQEQLSKKVNKVLVIGMAGGLFIALVLVLSLFIYRPWCHFFCPFGLVGWLAEKISIFKIKVDYDKCVSCEACSKACPSTVTDAILKKNRIIPDCFSCGTAKERVDQAGDDYECLDWFLCLKNCPHK